MKKLLVFSLAVISTTAMMAQGGPAGKPGVMPQNGNGQTVADLQKRSLTIVVNKELGDMVSQEWASRGLLKDAGNAALQTGKTSFIGAATSLIELGVDQLFKLATRNKRRHNAWLDVVRKQNQWTDTITTVNDVKDFYSSISNVGALDPEGIQFDGFDYKQDDNGELAYHIHCSVDKSEAGLDEITNHGNFRLIIDTLYINPYICNLPNTSRDNRKYYSFNFEKGADNVRYSLDFAIVSSWMNQAIEYFRNQKIGEFSIALNLGEENLNATDSKGRKVFRYIRGDKSFKGITPQIAGKSLIVPRSYIGRVQDENGIAKDVWSTGEYNVKLALNETRNINDKLYWNDPKLSPNYWKDDYSRRINSTSKTLYSWYIQNFGQNGETIVTKIISSAAKPFVNKAADEIFSTSSTTVAGGNGAGFAGAAAGGGAAAGMAGGNNGKTPDNPTGVAPKPDKRQ